MKLIDRITDDAIQTMILTGNSGQRINLSMRYMPSQQSWFMDVYYGSFAVFGVRVVASVNMLRNYKDIIPFGLACTTEQGVDPYRISDFSNQFAKMYLLNSDDVETFEEALFE